MSIYLREKKLQYDTYTHTHRNEPLLNECIFRPMPIFISLENSI